MDINQKIKFNPWKYLLGIGAGLGLGYLTYKAFFSKGKRAAELSLDSLSKFDAEQRSSILSDIKYNLYVKLNYAEDDLNSHLRHLPNHRCPVKGRVEIEFHLDQVKDLSLEFSGLILELSKSVDNKNQKIKFIHDHETKKVFIDKSNFIKGKNTLVINFSVKDCERGIVYSDKVLFFELINLFNKIYI